MSAHELLVSLSDASGEGRSWELAGACMDPTQPVSAEVMFPTRARGRSNSGAEAKATCRSCPVTVECLVASLERREKFGIWGGAGESIRRALGRLWRDRSHVEAFVPDCPCSSCVAIGRHLEAVAAGVPSRLDSNGPGARHGTAVTYNRGCRCDECALGRALHDAGLEAAGAAWWLDDTAEVAA